MRSKRFLRRLWCRVRLSYWLSICDVRPPRPEAIIGLMVEMGWRRVDAEEGWDGLSVMAKRFGTEEPWLAVRNHPNTQQVVILLQELDRLEFGR